MELISTHAMIGVALIALGMVCSPGPNMIYLTSRSISQGRRAGLISLGGVAVGFMFYLVAAATGLAALFAAVPAAYTTVKIAGAIYLAWLAWQILRPGGTSVFTPNDLPSHSAARLFTMGLVTNLLNPKIALMYAALIPQFVSPDAGMVWWQFLQLGSVQVLVAVSINALIVLSAAALARYLLDHPKALQAQRILSGSLLGFFAAKLAVNKPA